MGRGTQSTGTESHLTSLDHDLHMPHEHTIPRRLFVALAAATTIHAYRATAVADEVPLQKLFDDSVRLLFAGKPEASAQGFDALVQARPEMEPHLWQRGLALYYANRFADGRRQFELHRTVNPADVENVTWHFACMAREAGPEAARQAILPVGDDGRVPMKEVLAFYCGAGPADAVITAADSAPEATRRDAHCYGHLYLGLHAEALGQADAAREHMVLAAGKYSMDHFMGKIAALHVRLRGWDLPHDR